MGALTLKNFPFELRGWEIEKIESFDPTDGFCSSNIVYLNKNKIVQIEPFENNWLSDKGRHYFDGIFDILSKNKNKKKSWVKLYNKIIKTIYIFEYCHKQTSKSYFFTIVFDFLSFEILSLLLFISKKYSFINLKQIQPFTNINTDLESTFQLNNFLNKTTLISSTLCLLVSTNPRHEAYVLNLNLRQRVLKKKFKCIIIGSLINLTFPVSFLGSNINIIQNITEGNNFICQNFKSSTNSFLICNSELLKRNDNKTINRIFKTFFYLYVFNKTWYGLNILNSSISETGTLTFYQNTKFKLKDLNNFSCIYFLNVTTNKLASFKKIIELQLIISTLFNTVENKLFLDHNYKINNNLTLSNNILTDYLYIPNNTFYENEETYINTKGFIKRTTKIISKNNIKNNWQILRKILKYFKTKLICFNKKNNRILFFNSNKLYNFKNFINFQYYPIKKITNLGYYLNIKNKTFIMNKIKLNFKIKSKKFNTTKLKYYLNGFFNNNKDKFTQNSVVLNNCYINEKYNSTNFF